jgi:3-phenylpropionate/cinnamic acid dioxygenase small subunit
MVRLSRQEAEDFLYHEAELLDERRLEEWLTLFADDGLFWIPIDEHADPQREPSILYDDSGLRAVRVHQLLHEPHYAQMPPSRTVHHVTNVRVAGESARGEVVVRCNLSVAELRGGEHRQLHYGLGREQTWSARCEYHLRPRDGAWAIALKKVVLVNHDLPVYNLSFIL